MAMTKKRVAICKYAALLIFMSCVLLVGISAAKMASTEVIERNDEIQVAGWSVDVSTTSSDSMTLDAGEGAQTYELTVANNSDVASDYAIKVSNIPSGVKIGLDIQSDSDLVVPTAGEVVFTNTSGSLGYAAPDNTRSHVLTLVAEPTANITQNGVNMSIEVQFAQKDPEL